jgi:hypothetical protein
MTDQGSLVKRKIKLLKDVIGKIKAGEVIDVEAALGAGDSELEKEWADGQLNLSC